MSAAHAWRSARALAGAGLVLAFSGGAALAQTEASTEVRDTAGRVVGAVSLHEQGGKVRLVGRFAGLPAGFHVHAVGQCSGNFISAGGHLNPAGASHPSHADDMPTLLADPDGTAEARFEAARYGLAQLMDADGSAIIIHAAPDNYATIPDRYAAAPDATTLATGDAGSRIGCGVIAAGPPRAAAGQRLATQDEGTQAAFRAVWGDLAEEQWVLQHSASLARTP